MKHLKIFENNEELYLKKQTMSSGEDKYLIISEKDGSIVATLEFEGDELLLSPMSTWRKFTIDEVSKILDNMKILLQTDKYNL